MKCILVPVYGEKDREKVLQLYDMYDDKGKWYGSRTSEKECRSYLACIAGTKIEVEIKEYDDLTVE